MIGVYCVFKLRMKLYLSLALAVVFALSACKINKKQSNKQPEKYFLEDVVVKPAKSLPIAELQVMRPQVSDLLHTRLALSFDYERQWVLGKALLSFAPYHTLPDSLHLDAKGFEINRVGVLFGKDTLEIPYRYDGKQLHLPYGKSANLLVFIDYTAKPNELEKEGGNAITDSRGLYFINPLGKDPHKPRQIWTQGETEYNSCWFPTIDAPNEKHTQDIYITVDSGEVSLSNGILLSVQKLPGGKHIDRWQQLKPHAPYLTMLAVGNFVITKETWRGKEVSYYLEPAFAPYAKAIFGKTTHMLDIFSRLTGVEYPWEKFSQIVCRDFVSGAMENTSAVLHGEFVQQDNRGLLDNPQEDIIAHELFHHWFGDLVTSRSWGHLPLNESFATYGEYLYHEAALGKEEADRAFARNLEYYLRQKNKQQVSPIRQYFSHADDMFDVVSYQKGSWILHHLRSVIGDSAFFNGMKIYLTENAYQATDIHNLRMAMEKASGADLIPFFDRWFLSKGHPLFFVGLNQNANGKLEVSINQMQDSSFGLFQLNLPLTLVYADGRSVLHVLEVKNKSQIFLLEKDTSLPVLTWFADAKGEIPMQLTEDKTEEAWFAQLKYTKYFPSRNKAYQHFNDPRFNKNLTRVKATQYLLEQKQWFYQKQGIALIGDTLFEQFEPSIIAAAKQTDNYDLATYALEVLVEKFGYEKHQAKVFDAFQSPSYEMLKTGIQILADHQKDTLLLMLPQFESLNNDAVQKAIASVYAKQANLNYNAYYAANLGRFGYAKRAMRNSYLQYLIKQNGFICKEAILVLETHFEQSTEADIANTLLNFLNQWKAKSVAKDFFESADFKDFYDKVEAATRI